jgi:hypothetical protein
VPVLTERVVGSRRYGYCGTFDLVADIAGTRWLLDWKTSGAVYPETGLQLAAYRYADAYLGDDGVEIPMSEVGIERCGVVRLAADGSYDLRPVAAEEDPQFRFFLHALWIARHTPDMETWVGESL